MSEPCTWRIYPFHYYSYKYVQPSRHIITSIVSLFVWCWKVESPHAPQTPKLQAKQRMSWLLGNSDCERFHLQPPRTHFSIQTCKSEAYLTTALQVERYCLGAPELPVRLIPPSLQTIYVWTTCLTYRTSTYRA